MIFYGYTGAASPSCRTSSFQMPPRGFDTGIDAGRTDAARKRAAPGRVRVRSLAARGAAGFLVVLAALVALPLAAQAQTPSTDATLSGLVLKNASNDSPIALNPPFTTSRVGYFADVANGVTAITVEPTSANNATFAYLNASNTVLSDADTNKTGFQVALAVASNSIKVKVTAEDGNTTIIYRVAVLRATITAAAGITVSKTELTVTEEDATGDTYTVVLDHQPAADVLVAVSGTLDTDVSASPRTLTFTPMNWNTPRTVTVTAGTDANTEDETVTLTHSTASTDSNYNGITIDNVTVTVNDDDTPVALTLTPSAVSVSEGSMQPFTVELASVPAGPVTVGVESGDPGAATVDPASLAFTTTDWNQPQTVTVTGVQDGDTADERVTITLSGAGVRTGTVTVDVTDDTPVALTLTPSAVSVSEGSTQPFTVELASVPAGPVTVGVESGDPGAATVDSASLAFTTTDWNQPQTVTVTGVQDGDTADERVTITLSGAGVRTGTVTVDVTDDTPVALTLTPSAVSVSEDSTQPFTVELASVPAGPVTVSVESGDPGAATVDPASLAFTTTDWNQPQTVTVTGVQDGDTADERVTITLSGAGVRTGMVTVDVTDNDTPPPPPPPPLPERPGALDVRPGAGTLALSWTAVADADSYTVQWRSGSQEYSGTRQQTVALLHE